MTASGIAMALALGARSYAAGLAFISLAQAQFGPRFVRSSTGTRFVFSARDRRRAWLDGHG